MEHKHLKYFIKNVLENMPSGWLHSTTHRLDIYNEGLAKTEFTNTLEALYKANNFSLKALEKLPTAYDYIRLGHPLSCFLEWSIAKTYNLDSKNVIGFSSKTMPLLAILRQNALEKKSTQIVYTHEQPNLKHLEVLKQVYGYTFSLKRLNTPEVIESFDGSTIFISENKDVTTLDFHKNIDFHVTIYKSLGSVLLVNGDHNKSYISHIQHVRRRESIAMTPANCLVALQKLLHISVKKTPTTLEANKAAVLSSIKTITGTNTRPLVGSSGLSIQYAIMMGLVEHAMQNHMGKAIKFVVPPNCYGGTNDQARRVAAAIDCVEVVDLPVDGDNDMVQSIDTVLAKIAQQDAIAYIIAEIPTNPRVEVPDLEALKKVLSASRKTSSGEKAIDPVFILDQTFCPNLHFLSDGATLSGVKAIAYASGSKFPSGGLCTAGYCIANKKGDVFTSKIALHLELCDNEATDLQYEILSKAITIHESKNKRRL